MSFLRYLLTAILCLGLISCGGNSAVPTTSGSRLQVVTTIAPLYSMTVNVAGEYADVTNLVPIGSSEHMYQARPGDVALLSRADVVIKNGVNLELFLDPLLESSAKTGRVIVDTSSGITLLEGDDHHGEEEERHSEVAQEKDLSHEAHAKGDPHIWLSIQNAKIQVKNIEKSLSTADPVHAQMFKDNALSYISRLDELEKTLKNKLSSVPKKPYILFHDGFQYFEKEFGLKSSGVIQEFPGKEPSVQYLRNLYDAIETLQVRIAFTEPQFSPKVIEQLKTRFHLATAELDTIGTSLSAAAYEELITKNIQAFLDTFSQIQ